MGYLPARHDRRKMVFLVLLATWQRCGLRQIREGTTCCLREVSEIMAVFFGIALNEGLQFNERPLMWIQT